MLDIYKKVYLNNYFEPIKSNNIILEFAPNLCTPQKFMDKVRFDINNNYDFENKNILTFIYTLNQIITISGEDLLKKEKFIKYLTQIKNENSEFCLAVIFCPCNNINILIKHLLKVKNINQEKINCIINRFQTNKNLPACTFLNFPYIKSDDIIICLNSTAIKTQSKFEISLNHELEHYFDKYIHLNEETDNIERDLEILFKDINDITNFLKQDKYKDLKQLLIKLNYIDEKDRFNTYDFIQHMFLDDEFYPMCANLSNTFMFSLQTSNLSANEKLEKILSKCNKEYLLSDNFKNLYPAVQDMLIFLYINKIISPEKRYQICIETLKAQFKEDTPKLSFFNKTKNWFKKFIANFKNKF